ncbi:MAG: hypothetical protein FJX29_08845 [Alphaproteobacteria bacterium]|nr:hypothetical protein [Alphaproteobacteria bacterium]
MTGQSDPAGVTRRHLFSNTLLNSSPLLLLLLCAALLMMPLRLPIGPNYWDLAIFTDAAHRMNLGQRPNVDFRTPAGPLVYFQYAWMEKLFPHGHPALIASWSALPLASLLFSLTLSQIADYSNRTKLALVLPFLFFAFLPFNSSASFPVPGIDAFGIYNR